MSKTAYVVESNGFVSNALVFEDNQDPTQFGAIFPPENVILAVGGTYIDGVSRNADGDVIPPFDPNIILISLINATRNKLLQETDWTQLLDVNLSNKDEFATYRQALRDIDKQQGYPQNVVYPTKPQEIWNT
jgi:hypothetical protein